MEVTAKILDNTVISSFLKEIKSVDVISRCPYKIITSKEVCEECKKFNKDFAKSFGKNLFILDPEDNKLYLEFFNYLISSYPYFYLWILVQYG